MQSQIQAQPIVTETNITPANPEWQAVISIGGWAGMVITLCAILTMLVVSLWGAEPATAADYFSLLQQQPLIGLLRMDFPTLINIFSYLFFFYGLWLALKKGRAGSASLVLLIGVAGVVLFLSSNSVYSMLMLNRQHAAATTAAQRTVYEAAGEAIIAADMYKSSSGRISGLMIQGCATLFSLWMLKSPYFKRWFAWAGILGNGLDLLRIFLDLFFLPNTVLLMIAAGPLILVWILFSGLHLLRLAGQLPPAGAEK